LFFPPFPKLFPYTRIFPFFTFFFCPTLHITPFSFLQEHIAHLFSSPPEWRVASPPPFSQPHVHRIFFSFRLVNMLRQPSLLAVIAHPLMKTHRDCPKLSRSSRSRKSPPFRPGHQHPSLHLIPPLLSPRHRDHKNTLTCYCRFGECVSPGQSLCNSQFFLFFAFPGPMSRSSPLFGEVPVLQSSYPPHHSLFPSQATT